MVVNVTADLTGFFVPIGLIEAYLEVTLVMQNKRFSAEQILILLRQIQVLISQGKGAPIACRESRISQQSYYRRRKEYGGLSWIRLGV